MARKRKTEAERRAEREEAVRQVWLRFEPRLAAMRSLKDAVSLYNEAPIETAPGRKFYSNLGFFLQTLRRPAGASGAEVRHYLALLPHLEAEGAITPESRKAIEAEFERSSTF